MRKVALIICMVCACFMVYSVSFAEYVEQSETVLSYEIANDDGRAKTSVIPTTSIRPLIDKVVGYVVMPLNALSKENYTSLFDGTDLTLSGECLGENEAPAGASGGELFPKHKKVENGVVVHQGSFTRVIVFFIRS